MLRNPLAERASSAELHPTADKQTAQIGANFGTVIAL
jgi:hypothetical protein